MPQRVLLDRLALVLLLAATVGPKLWLEKRSVQADVERLNADVAGRLRAIGFRVSTPVVATGPAVSATRGACHLLVRNGDRARELGRVFELEAADYGPVAIGYRGVWRTRPAGARSVLERLAQDGAARVGLFFERPAVLALAHGEDCEDVRDALAGIRVHAA